MERVCKAWGKMPFCACLRGRGSPLVREGNRGGFVGGGLSRGRGDNTRHGPGANSGFAPGPCRFVGGEGRAAPYIMPPIPPMPGAMAGMAGASSFFSAMTHSVVRNIPAIDAAFSRATRVTFAGSMTPET